MSFIDSDITKSIVGPVAAGPAGFGVGYDVSGGAHATGNAIGVEVTLNKQSMMSAKAQLESGENIQVAKTLDLPRASKSLTSISHRSNSVENKYAALVSSAGLSRSAEHGLTKGAWAHKPNYKSALNPKCALMRIRQRQLLQLRKTFDEIPNKRTVDAVVPEHILERRANTALKIVEAAHKFTRAPGYNPAEWRRWGHSLIGGSFPDAVPAPRPG